MKDINHNEKELIVTNFNGLNALSSNFEDYLKTIGDIEVNKGHVRSKDIARVMGVSPSSVTNALQILEEKNLIDYTPYSSITLTDRGRQTWRFIHQKYQAFKGFLTDILEIDNKAAAELACTIEHSISSQVIERFMLLKRLLMEDNTCGSDVKRKLHECFSVKENETEK